MALVVLSWKQIGEMVHARLHTKYNNCQCRFSPSSWQVNTSAPKYIDKVNTDSAHIYLVGFLNSLNVSGLPFAWLALKPGCPLMLLCNLDPVHSLCTGTHMILLGVRTMVFRCRILGGDHAGNVVFNPRLSSFLWTQTPLILLMLYILRFYQECLIFWLYLYWVAFAVVLCFGIFFCCCGDFT